MTWTFVGPFPYIVYNMFWKYNQLPLQIDTVLFKEDTTLDEVLDQENVLQELKSQNKKLIEFITRDDIINQLVGLVIDEPSEELEDAEKYQRPNLACEVLTTDIPIVNERLSNKALLMKLYSFLERDPPLNPLLASFFSRTLSMLICRKADQNWYSYQFTCLQFLEFLKTKENSLSLLLKHLDTSAIMDLTLKLITQIEGSEMQNNLISWIESEGLIENIIALFDSKVDEGRHYNAAQLLCDTIRKCREMSSDLDPIVYSIQSTEMIQKLLGHMLNGEHVESSIVGGVSVLLTLLEPPLSEQITKRGTYNSVEDSGSGEPPPSPNPALYPIVSAIVPYLPALHDLLLNPPNKPPVKLACGTIEPPLGNTRLTVIKLIAALIATNTPEVNEELDRLNTVHVLLDLFFHYTWNNFLHSQVDRCLAFALNSNGQESIQNPLIHSIFIKCRLLQRILEAWEENENEQNKTGGKRRGYMGHLTNIANSVIKQGDCLIDFINRNIDENTLLSWTNYVQNTLQPINELHQRFLGGSHPAHNINKNEDMDYNDASFADDASLNQNFSDFANPASMNRDFIENFSYVARDLNSLEDSNKDARAELFKEICAQKKAFADLEAGMDDEEVWEDGAANVWNNTDDFSSGSDEENEKNSPKLIEKSEPNLLAPVIDPWFNGAENENSNDGEGWADFSSFDAQFEQSADTQQNEEVNFQQENSSASGVSEVLQKKEISPLPLDESATNVNANANTNDLVLEDVVHEEELIDNFRFLSIQGLISEKKVGQSEKTEDGLEVKHQEEKKPLSIQGLISEKEIQGQSEKPEDNKEVKHQEEKNAMEKQSERSQSTTHEPDPV